MNFKTKATANTTIKAESKAIPLISISEKAINQMYIYTKEVNEEVGWLGTVFKADNSYFIEETFLFDQEVHSTTTEITPEGLAKFGEALLKRPDGVDVWNSLKMWGHSHVNMPTNPSAQDDFQMKEFANIGHDFFIRLIANKKGDIRIDFYDYARGLTFLDVPYVVESSVNPEVQKVDMQLGLLREQMQKLENEMSLLINKDITDMTPQIQEEIKVKVRKKTYAPLKSTYQNPYGNYWGGADSFYNQQGFDDAVGTVELDDLFSEKEIIKLAYSIKTKAQLEVVLNDLGYKDLYKKEDLQNMYSKLIQLKWSVK